MSLYRLQGKSEKRSGIYYEFDPTDEPLGQGGMGKVYKGRCVDENTGNTHSVAIKFMYSDLPPYAIEKARREAAIHFRHDNLIEMLGFIETESKSVLGEPQLRYHVVSELLEGVSLDKLFKGKLTDQNGKFVPFAEKLHKDYQQDVNHFTIEVIRNVLSGLMTMHDAGFIHRDIDPTNIMVTSNGHIKLIDFGIAKKMNSLTSHDKHLTQAGQFVGKPEYAAPELILGAIDEQNQTTDIYAVGILMFQCLVGHVPFEGDRSDVLQKQLHSSLPLKLIKNKRLRQIVAKATEKSRSKRFQSAAEFRVALDRLNSTSGSSFDWNTLRNYMLGLFICGLLGYGTYYYFSRSKSDFPVVDEQEETVNYGSAMKAIKDHHDISKMIQLSESGNSDATYLLSRLYFKSKTPNTVGDFIFDVQRFEYQSDSISQLKKSLAIEPDNIKAHNYLKKAIEQNPKHYQALFELACDYWRSNDRTEAVAVSGQIEEQRKQIEEQRKQAKEYFLMARSCAKEVGNLDYVAMIDAYLYQVADWEKYLQSK